MRWEGEREEMYEFVWGREGAGFGWYSWFVFFSGGGNLIFQGMIRKGFCGLGEFVLFFLMFSTGAGGILSLLLLLLSLSLSGRCIYIPACFLHEHAPFILLLFFGLIGEKEIRFSILSSSKSLDQPFSLHLLLTFDLFVCAKVAW